MNVWSWSAFFMRGVGDSLSGAKVFIHFFPVANGVSAPYPVHAFLEVFAKGKLVGRQGFDGLRINQPDGLDLADVFPALFGGSVGQVRSQGEAGLAPASERDPVLVERELGITVELGTTQPRVDLSRSRVMIEIRYPSHHLRFHAVQAGQDSNARGYALREDMALFSHDGYETRLVEVNPAPSDRAVSGEEGPSSREMLAAPENSERLAGHCLRSIPIDNKHLPLASGEVKDGGYKPSGRLAKALDDETESLLDDRFSTVRYLVQYEPVSSLPVSVRCL